MITTTSKHRYSRGLWHGEDKYKDFNAEYRRDEVIQQIIEEYEARLKYSIKVVVYIFFAFSVLQYIMLRQLDITN